MARPTTPSNAYRSIFLMPQEPALISPPSTTMVRATPGIFSLSDLPLDMSVDLAAVMLIAVQDPALVEHAVTIAA